MQLRKRRLGSGEGLSLKSGGRPGPRTQGLSRTEAYAYKAKGSEGGGGLEEARGSGERRGQGRRELLNCF